MSKIIFSPVNNWIGMGIDTDVLLESIPHPVPAAKMIPDYYKQIPSTINDYQIQELGLQTLKKCMPFLDPMTTGYIIPAWTDFVLDVGVDGTSRINIPTTKPVEHDAGQYITDHAKPQFPYHPFEKVYPYSENILKFMSPWYINTPKGYSVLFTNPFNHFVTDVKILDGIVDTDEHKLEVNFPFIWTGFEAGRYIIEKGTPLVQVFPFKRDTLQLDVRVATKKEEKAKKVYIGKYMTTLKDFYTNNIWSKRKK